MEPLKHLESQLAEDNCGDFEKILITTSHFNEAVECSRFSGTRLNKTLIYAALTLSWVEYGLEQGILADIEKDVESEKEGEDGNDNNNEK
ncbi:hypothetical protein BM1_00500 [Bipolaris maydis]|nr:hypothetical protein BM1_00500 [Bipolaris maydis]